ncbi:hypothetical protein DAY19_11600 [Halobacteriovorax vibrionivorans]|uniref:Uncharacterized protein n=1 Tax=Halobacteriovorax vibrionivorans TaxID=2152716 RepID=A0ABY0ICC4_9BACT|nr:MULTISPECIES: replication-relaxation family protein [Halobacteriovorax]RZF20623.1 hypothetical protein DAY19_11600 [Halobacteriovorax vibrionivorans]TGD48966.1 hypothetical protein EP118_02130 [Halobacteriovorax sp. Y22]
MSEVININNRYFDFLGPLQKWRILDLNSLRDELFPAPNYHNFARYIRKLEKLNLIGGYIDPFTKKKFIYLSPKGEKYLSVTGNPSAIANETLVHDIKVTELTKELSKLDLVDDVVLEHEISDKRNFRTTYKVIPDAILSFKKNNFNYRVALELELTRKSNSRIIEKVKQYQSTEYYHYLMYVFPSIKLMDKYREVIRNQLGDKALTKIMFFYHDSLTRNVRDVKAVKGWIGDKESELIEVFK